MHDVSCRIPMIVRYPEKFEANRQISKAVSLIDLALTFLDLAETEMGTHKTDGESLIAFAENKTDREYVYSQYSSKGSAIYMAVSER